MKTRVVSLLTLLLLAAAPAQLLVAHRGASASAPENTLAAFRESWDEGAELFGMLHSAPSESR